MGTLSRAMPLTSTASSDGLESRKYIRIYVYTHTYIYIYAHIYIHIERDIHIYSYGHLEPRDAANVDCVVRRVWIAAACGRRPSIYIHIYIYIYTSLSKSIYLSIYLSIYTLSRATPLTSIASSDGLESRKYIRIYVYTHT